MRLSEVQYVDYKKYYFVKPNTFNLYSYYGHRKFKSCVASVNFYAKPQRSEKKQLVIFSSYIFMLLNSYVMKIKRYLQIC